MRVFLIVGFMLVAMLLSSSVLSVSTQVAQFTNCQFDVTNGTCGSVATASCGASLVNYGDMVVTGVSFVINGNSYAGSLVSGNYTNGTWSYQYTMGPNDNGQAVSLDNVVGSISDGSSCIGSQKPVTTTQPLCYVSYGTQTAVGNSCTCTYTDTAGALRPDNTQTFTRVPSAGCGVNAQTTTYTAWADYCDPQWTAQYSACSVTDNSTLSGTMSKSYVSGNPSCCTATAPSGAGHLWFNHNGGSDCDPPPDAGAVSCTLDSWARQQGDVQGSGGTDRSSGFTYGGYNTATVSAVSAQQPLMYDIEGDGQQEVIILDNTTSAIEVYTPSMTLQSSLSVAGASFLSQPALVGIDDLGIHGQRRLDSSVSSGTAPRMVVPLKIAGTSYLKTYILSGGIPAEIHSTSYGSANLSGVACYNDFCYFMDSSGLAHKYDPYGYVDVTQDVTVLWNGTDWSDFGSGLMRPNLVPTIAFANNPGGERVLWSFYFYYVLNATTTKNIYIMATDTDLNRYALYRMPLIYAGSGGPVQTLIGNIATSYGNGHAGFSYDEVGAADSNFSFERVAEINLLSSLGSVHGDVSASSGAITTSLVWSGVKQSSAEGISNTVATDSGFCAEDIALSGSQQSASVGRTAPYVDITVPGSNGVNNSYTFFTSDHLYMIQASSPGVNFTRVSDGSLVYSSAYPFGYNSVSNVLFDSLNDRLYAQVSSGPLDAIDVFDFSNRASPHSFFTGEGSTGQLMYAPVLVGNYIIWYHNDPSFPELYKWSRSGPLNFSSLQVLHEGSPPFFNMSNAGELGNLLIGSQYPPPEYDAVHDVLAFSGFSNSYVLFNATKWLNDNIEGSSTNNWAWVTVSGTSMRAMNFGSPVKFMTGSGQKVVMTGNAYNYTTSLSCGSNFLPLYYAADNYILGYNTVTRFLGYCDFSDETHPLMTYYSSQVSNTTLHLIAEESIMPDQEWMITESSPTLEGRSWAFDFTRSAAGVVSSGVFSTAVCFDYTSAFARSKTIAMPSVPKALITKADVDGDGQDDLIGSNGIASLGKSLWVKNFTSGISDRTSDWVVPVDLDSDTHTDLIWDQASASLLRALTNKVALQAVTAGAANITKFICTNVNGSGYTTFQIIGRLPDPSQVNMIVQPGDGSILTSYGTSSLFSQQEISTGLFGIGNGQFFLNGTVAPGQAAQGQNGQFAYSYAQSGTYTATATISQVNNSGLQATASCTVHVSLASLKSSSTCGMGTDGEFNYVDSIRNHNWAAGRDISPANGILSMTSDDSLSYSLSNCSFTSVLVTESVNPNTGAGLQVFGNSTSDVFGLKFDANGNILASDGANIGSWTSGFVLVQIEVDPSTGKGYIFINGTLAYSKDNIMSNVGGVIVFGNGAVDYVRISNSGIAIGGQGGTVVSKKLLGDTTFLQSCDAATLEQSTDLGVRRGHPDIDLYCTSNGMTGCEYADLQSIVQAYPECAKEVYNYCVYVSYPKKQGMTNAQLSGGLQGGTVCAAVLGAGSAVNGILIPTLGIGWNVITSSVVVMLFLLLLVLLLVAVRRR